MLNALMLNFAAPVAAVLGRIAPALGQTVRMLPDSSQPFSFSGAMPAANLPAMATANTSISIDGINFSGGGGDIDQAMRMFSIILRQQIAQ